MKAPMAVLEIKTELEREEDGYELFSQGLVGERFRYPVIKVEMRVGVMEPIGWSEPTQEAAEGAAEL